MSQPTTASMLPSETEAALAKETSRVLASCLRGDDLMRLRIIDGRSRDIVKLPAAAARLLMRILEEMARGNGVNLIPVHAEITTQQAADMLNISRPSLIQLLDEVKIDYRRVGTHRRVQLDALMKYKRQVDAARRATLADLAAYDQELGI
jgi:excisionase family DNA binding protein